jgi:hypothetical protein
MSTGVRPQDGRVTHHVADPSAIHHVWDRDLAPALTIDSGDTVDFTIPEIGAEQIRPGAGFADCEFDFDTIYAAHSLGYQGPKFGYAPIPDQYTLSELRRRELAPTDRPPVMAEIDLVSSHHPWTPLPTMVPWDHVGDGSAYADMSQQPGSAEVFRDPELVKRMYGESVEYTWQALTSFLTTFDDPDLVVIALGDHQPHSYVSGEHVGHDVPITVIAQDPAVMARIAGWGWQDGLRPDPDAPVSRMDTFRDRFLEAFSTAQAGG